MSDEVRLSITGENRGIKRTLSDTERAYIAHERKTKALFGRMGRGIGRSALGFTRSLAAPVTALAGGAALLAAGKNLMTYEAQLTRLAIAGSLTAAQQKQLNKEIMDSAFATGQSRNAILGGIETIVEQTGDLQFARDAIRDIGIAATASGAEMQSLAALSNQLKEKLNIGKGDLGAALNLLTVQGKAGAFNLKDMANNGERLFAAAGRFDMSGLDSLRRFGALLQVARMGTGSSEQATTSIEGIFTDILDKQKQISRHGVQIYTDKDKTKLKSVDTIIKDIITKTKGREDLLGNIFGRQSIRGITSLAKLYRDTGGFALFDELVSADAERAGEIMQDFARYAETAEFKVRQLGNVLSVFGDAVSAGFLRSLNVNLGEIFSDPEKLDLFKSKVESIGAEVGKIGTLAFDAVAAFAELSHLATVIMGTLKIVNWILTPIAWLVRGAEKMKAFSDKDMEESQKAVDAYNRKNRKYTSQMYEQFFQKIGMPGAPIIPPPQVTVENIIYNEGNIQTSVDSKTSSGNANVKTKTLPRGVHPVAK